MLGGSNIFPALTLKTNTVGLKPQGGLEFRWIPCFFFNVIFISKPIAIPSRAITNGVFYLCLSTRPRCGVFAGLELFYWRDALDSQIRSHQTRDVMFFCRLDDKRSVQCRDSQIEKCSAKLMELFLELWSIARYLEHKNAEKQQLVKYDKNDRNLKWSGSSKNNKHIWGGHKMLN